MIFNTYRFSTATLVTRTHLNVTFIRIVPVMFIQDDQNSLCT